MLIDDFRCEICGKEFNFVDKHEEPIPVCCGQETIKNWAHCNVRAMNRGEPVNARYTNCGTYLNKFSSRDDPLCQIEVGLKADNHSGIRSFTPEQAKEYRERVAREDSPKLRQEILDVRDRNLSEKKQQKIKKTTMR